MTLNVMRRHVLPGARHLHDVDIHTADGCGGPDGGHQRPAVYPGVSQVNHQVVVPSLTQENKVNIKYREEDDQLPGERRLVLLLLLHLLHPDLWLPSLQLDHQQQIL